MSRILSPEVVAQLTRFRLSSRRRVQGRYAGAHASKRYGASLDFADHREYVRGDDPRRIDLAAYQRLGRLLVKLYEAEDEAAIRVVLDQSASMGFGRKLDAAREVTAAFAVLAAAGQDRIRVILTGGDGVDAGPWFRGPSTLPAVEHRLLSTAPPSAGNDPSGRPDLVAAVRRARAEGPLGPALLVSDLLFDGYDEVLRALASGRADALLVHVVGRTELEPEERGDLRLVDSETGEEVEVGIGDDVLDDYAATRDAWLADIERTAGRHGVVYARVVDDEPLETLLLTTLRRMGVVA